MIRSAIGAALATALTGCVYFNTFYNAKKYYAEGERLAAEALPASAVRPDASPAEGGALPPAARAAFEKAIEKSSVVLASHADSKYADDALLLLGKAHYWLGNFPQATAALKGLLGGHPDSELRREGLLWLARASRRGGDLAASEQTTNELLAAGELSPSDRIVVELERAQLARDTGDPGRALAIYRDLLARDLELARRHDVDLLAARARLEAGDPTGALEDLRALLAGGADPERQRIATEALAEAFARAGESEQARVTYQRLLEAGLADSLAARVHVSLAESHRNAGETPQAVEEFGKAAGLQPATALASRALYQRGLLEWRVLGARETAKQTFLEAFLQDPQGASADSAAVAARVIQEIQHYQAILAGSERVLAPIPEPEVMATATYLLGELLFTQEGRRDAARELFAQIPERYPQSVWAPKTLYTLGWLEELDEVAAAADAVDHLSSETAAGIPVVAEGTASVGQDVRSSVANHGPPSVGNDVGTPERPGPDASARVFYDRLIRDFPATEYARYARDRLGVVEADLLGVVDSASEQATAEAAAAPGAPLDETLLAYSRALPRPADPLLGIQDRLLARRRGGEGDALSPIERERQLIAIEEQAAAREQAAAADTLGPDSLQLPLGEADGVQDGPPGASDRPGGTPPQ